MSTIWQSVKMAESLGFDQTLVANSAIEFVEISSLSGHRISHVYFENSHPLLQTTIGELLECGNKCSGEFICLELSNPYVYLQVDAELPKSATFCFAGYATSDVLVDHSPVQIPNSRIIHELYELSEVAGFSVENARLKKRERVT